MIIGIAGYAGVGKDTLADLLVEREGFEKRAFANKLKEFYYKVAPLSHVEQIDELGWDAAKRFNIEIRAGLQGLGAAARSTFGKKFWIEQAMPNIFDSQEFNYVFADVRYENEAEEIWSRGGVVIRLKRDAINPANDHASELELDSIEADLVIENHSPESALSEVLEYLGWHTTKS